MNGDAQPRGPGDHRAARERRGGREGDSHRAGAVLQTRRYAWAVGVVGLALLIAFSIQLLTGPRTSTTGVAPGRTLHMFAAPLAASNLNGIPNPRPSCDPARHDPRALNLCLLVRARPVAVAFFVPQAKQCVAQVDAMQRLAARFGSVAFAAVAVGASHAITASLVRRHHWTIPIAYDSNGEVGGLYGVAACPMIELARRGGVVADRLIGDRWASTQALAPFVQALLAAP